MASCFADRCVASSSRCSIRTAPRACALKDARRPFSCAATALREARAWLDAGPYTLRNLNGQPGAIIKNYADEYAEHWANIWTVRLMSRSSNCA